MQNLGWKLLFFESLDLGQNRTQNTQQGDTSIYGR